MNLSKICLILSVVWFSQNALSMSCINIFQSKSFFPKAATYKIKNINQQTEVLTFTSMWLYFSPYLSSQALKNTFQIKEDNEHIEIINRQYSLGWLSYESYNLPKKEDYPIVKLSYNKRQNILTFQLKDKDSKLFFSILKLNTKTNELIINGEKYTPDFIHYW